MVARYAAGTRVRIRSAGVMSYSAYSEMRKYDNLTGEVVASVDLVGYFVRLWDMQPDNPIHVLHAYTVHLDAGTEIDNVVEECLEALQGPH